MISAYVKIAFPWVCSEQVLQVYCCRTSESKRASFTGKFPIRWRNKLGSCSANGMEIYHFFKLLTTIFAEFPRGCMRKTEAIPASQKLKLLSWDLRDGTTFVSSGVFLSSFNAARQDLSGKIPKDGTFYFFQWKFFNAPRQVCCLASETAVPNENFLD